MAYLSDFTTQLMNAVAAEGLPCCREYQAAEISSYGATLFATAAMEQLRFYAPISTQGGVAFPLTLQMRVRFYAPPEAADSTPETVCDTYLLPALVKSGWQLRGMITDAAAFEKEIGRICTTCHLTIEAVVMHLPDAAETNEEATQ